MKRRKKKKADRMRHMKEYRDTLTTTPHSRTIESLFGWNCVNESNRTKIVMFRRTRERVSNTSIYINIR